jgi:surfeit locus 1 family protein
MGLHLAPAGTPRFRPLFWPTVFTVPVVVLLLGLGFWQIERLFWKRELIAQRQAAATAAPIAAPRSLEEARGMKFHPVTDQGVFLHDKEIFLGATSEAGRNGYQVLTPLREPGGRIVFVNRGFIPAEFKDRAVRSDGQIAGAVRVRGLLRLPPTEKPAWFLPDNRADLNYWFWVDLPAMAAADGLDRVAPFYIDADATPNPGGWPKGAVTRLALRNDHLQYAITWFSLAVALIVIYFLYHRRHVRSG